MLLITKYSLYKTNVNMGQERGCFWGGNTLQIDHFFLKKCTK